MMKFFRRLNWTLMWIDLSLVFAVWIFSCTVSFLSLEPRWNIVGTREALVSFPASGLIVASIQIICFGAAGRYRWQAKFKAVKESLRGFIAVLITAAAYILVEGMFNNNFPSVPFPWLPKRSVVIYCITLIPVLSLVFIIQKKRRFILSKPDALDVGLILLALIGSILYIGSEGVLTIVGLFVSILVLCLTVRTIYLPKSLVGNSEWVVDFYGLEIIILGSLLMLVANDAEFFGLIVTCQGIIFFARDNLKFLETGRNIAQHLDVSAFSLVVLGFIVILVESALVYSAEGMTESSDTMGDKAFTIPEEWKQRYLTLEGAEVSYYWHGKLHIKNRDGMRTLREYEIQNDARRYVLLGDSFTYGLGIDNSATYSEVLQGKLKTEFRTEQIVTYNLGVLGAHSEKILDIAKHFLPKLQPHRVMYGVCLNDITYWHLNLSTEMAWSIPPIIGASFSESTKVGQLLSVGYNQLLMQIGIRGEFYSDILDKFDPNEDKFFQDVKEINQLSIKYSGKPVLVLVLNHSVGTDDPAHPSRKLSEIVEKQASNAGAEVIPAKMFYDEYGDGRIPFNVSKWEGHPNERAHRIWADMLFSYLVGKGGVHKAVGRDMQL